MHEKDKKKTAFTTPWGTFMYDKMPFGLMNVRVTFQRATNIAFVGEMDKFIFIYLDDMTKFSTSDEENLYNLRKEFLKCRKFSLSLNPKKSLFSLQEEKLLGHIISKVSVKIDLESLEAILKISLPWNKKKV